jgi:hypothetical protein
MRPIPAIYEYAAALLGVTPWAASRDAELLYRAHAAAFQRFGHASVVTRRKRTSRPC